MPDPPDRPTFQVIAGQWVTRLMTVALEMVLPGLLGYWMDRQLGTRFVFMLIGFGGGLTLGVWHLIRMTSVATQDKRSQRSDDGSGRRGSGK